MPLSVKRRTEEIVKSCTPSHWVQHKPAQRELNGQRQEKDTEIKVKGRE